MHITASPKRRIRDGWALIVALLPATCTWAAGRADDSSASPEHDDGGDNGQSARFIELGSFQDSTAAPIRGRWDSDQCIGPQDFEKSTAATVRGALRPRRRWTRRL